MFQCECCGMCCRHIGGVELYEDLDNGEGICKYLNQSMNLCKIYEQRPLKCRVDEAYKVVFKSQMSLEAYYQLNKEACEKLRRGV